MYRPRHSQKGDFLRVPHYIKQNADIQFPRHFIVVDTEAKIERKDNIQLQTFRLGCAIYLRWNDKTQAWIEKEYPLNELKDWYALLDAHAEPKRRLLVFAHNAAYDYTILKMDTYLSSRKYVVDAHVIDSAFIVRSHHATNDGISDITFASTTNFYQMSLEKLGKIFGDKKLEKPDFENVSDSELMTYCAQDTKVLATLLKEHIRFIRENDLGNFRLTIAGQAFGAYRHRFMTSPILVHTFDDILEMEMSSYRGGRCEAFKLGESNNIYKLDINSMYPYVMRENEFPSKIVSRCKVSDDKFPLEAIESGLAIMADCDIELNEPAIAIKREKLFFPIGKVRQVLSPPEVEYLLQHPDIGKIVKVHSRVTYEKVNLFRQYVDFFYKLRRDAPNEAIETSAKLYLNSLYGKFGQRSFESIHPVNDATTILRVNDDMDAVKTNVMDYMETGESIRYKRIGNILYKVNWSNDVLAYDSCPIIASAVTAYARCYLFDTMRTAGLGNVLYCDTDSLFVTEDGFKNLESLIHPTELGKLKLEEIGSCDIHGAKNYRFNETTKLKGVKKDAVKIAENTYSQSQFITKQMRYREGTPDGTVIVRQIVKHISTEYDKGLVLPSGEVRPFKFTDW